MISWKRLGLIHAVSGGKEWQHSHAALPFAVSRGENLFEIFFSSRDEENRSHGGSLLLELAGENFRVCSISEQPILEPGEAGLFDDSGVSLCSHVHFRGEEWLYYTGWTLGVRVPYQTFCGVAQRQGRESSFRKLGRVPVLDRTELDPYAVGFVTVRAEGDELKMWYESNEGWTSSDPQKGYRFVIRYATSRDGIHWERSPGSCLHLAAHEHVVSRPTILFRGSKYHMWYSRKENNKYLLGYAHSKDGMLWTRDDALAGLRPSGQGWDSDEIAYPAVFEHAGKAYLLYNGNSYGKSGFGLAVEG